MKISYRFCAVFFFVYVLFSTNATAATISVSQESAPGAGDFASNVLGTIDIFDTRARCLVSMAIQQVSTMALRLLQQISHTCFWSARVMV